MTEEKPKPTPIQLIVWAIPMIASLLFTGLTLVIHRGAELGFGALLASFLYFMIRYGSYTQDTPSQ